MIVIALAFHVITIFSCAGCSIYKATRLLQGLIEVFPSMATPIIRTKETAQIKRVFLKFKFSTRVVML